MNAVLTLRCDGRREYIVNTVQSIFTHVTNGFTQKFIIDDSGNEDYARWLDATFPQFDCIHHAERRGLGGCFKSSLETILTTSADYAFMVEDDTPLIADIDLEAMARVLYEHPNLSQIMLMRPPFNEEERRVGGVYQMTPNEFTEQTDGTNTWVEHARWYGFQPNLSPRNVIQFMVEKATNFLELGVTEPLLAANQRFAYWGGLNDAPMCSHDGLVRSNGYRW